MPRPPSSSRVPRHWERGLTGIEGSDFLAAAIGSRLGDSDAGLAPELLRARFFLSIDFLLSAQLPDHSWQRGSWHTSWALEALCCGGSQLDEEAVFGSCRWLLKSQCDNGSWDESAFETASVCGALASVLRSPSAVRGRLRHAIGGAIATGTAYLVREIDKHGDSPVASYELDRTIMVLARHPQPDRAQLQRLVAKLLQQFQGGKLWAHAALDAASAIRALAESYPLLEASARARVDEELPRAMRELLVPPGQSPADALSFRGQHAWGDTAHTAEVLLALQRCLTPYDSSDLVRPARLQMAPFTPDDLLFFQGMRDGVLAYMIRCQNPLNGGWFSRVETSSKMAVLLATVLGTSKIYDFSIQVNAADALRLVNNLRRRNAASANRLRQYRETHVTALPEYRRLERYQRSFKRLKPALYILGAIGLVEATWIVVLKGKCTWPEAFSLVFLTVLLAAGLEVIKYFGGEPED